MKNTKEITNNANTICPFKFFEVGDIHYQNQPTFCGKNGSVIHSWRFLDKNNMQLLQSLIIIIQAGRDNAVASASDCRYRGHEFEPTPCHITDVKANHKINLPSTDSRMCSWYTDAFSLRRSMPKNSARSSLTGSIWPLMCCLGHDTPRKQTQIFTTTTTIVCMCFISLLCLTNKFEIAVEVSTVLWLCWFRYW